MQSVSHLKRSCCACHHHQAHVAPKAPVLGKILRFDPLHISQRPVVAKNSLNGSGPAPSDNGGSNTEFCILESRDGVKDFEQLQLAEIEDNLAARKNKIFLLMEEIRRLRIQQRIKGGEVSPEQEVAREQYLSALPFLPPLSESTLFNYYTFYATFVTGVIVFGGLVAPLLKFNLGLGGTSYSDFIESVHLPSLLAQVDPIVASFCGGAVGVLSALLVVEINNVKQQRHNRCHYCSGTGYLTCGNCGGAGTIPLDTPALAAVGAAGASASMVALASPSSNGAVKLNGSGSNGSAPNSCTCGVCSGVGKVMCTGCLCTGKAMASEHDPRIDPFTFSQ